MIYVSRNAWCWALGTLVGLLVSGLEVAAADPTPVVKMQGTWHDDSGASGTWRAELHGGSGAVFQKATEFGTWESFEGTARFDTASTVEEAPVAAWADSSHVGFRITDGKWQDTLFSGDVTGTEAKGTFRQPGGQTGEWRGWWIRVENNGARTVETAVEKSEVLNPVP